jgi:molybdopterin converting factor small subunit
VPAFVADDGLHCIGEAAMLARSSQGVVGEERSMDSVAGETVVVKLFAGLAETVGQRSPRIAWNGGTAGELRERLQQTFPQAAGLLARSAVAVGDAFCRDDEQVCPGADVALIPPVSGG